jgi:hypothetical protein
MIRCLVLGTLLVLVAGCGGEKAESQQSAAAEAANELPTSEALPNQEAQLAGSVEGNFEAFWPSGCARLRTRTINSATNPDAYAVVDVTCEREGDENRGARITLYNEMTGGGVASPEMVTRTIGELISSLGVQIRKQRPISRNGRDGVAAFCGETSGTRQVWIEGFIDEGRVLVIMAWGLDDSLYEDPEIKKFFSSVRLTG